jgi:hypothetical protein
MSVFSASAQQLGTMPPPFPAVGPAESALLPSAVVFHACTGRVHGSDHDLRTKAAVARSIAALFGVDCVEGLAAVQLVDGPAYVVPSHTLAPSDEMPGFRLDESNFFGGFAPRAFIATKLITHPLVHANAQAPRGWSTALCDHNRQAVLPGRSVFSAADARIAADELLVLGKVRVKEPDGVGGAGQHVITGRDELDDLLGRMDAQLVSTLGLVLEQNLDEVSTCSVGQVRVGPWLASYVGTQRLTVNGQGHEVYGGSTLDVVLGGMETLLSTPLGECMRLAVDQALTYHRAAFRCFPGLVASRCNYDIAQGIDKEGRWKSGVLEQSWRIGGASGAEIAALQAFRDDPGLHSVRASTHEVYGAEAEAPAKALVLFDGLDQHGDHLLKYVQLG